MGRCPVFRLVRRPWPRWKRFMVQGSGWGSWWECLFTGILWTRKRPKNNGFLYRKGVWLWYVSRDVSGFVRLFYILSKNKIFRNYSDKYSIFLANNIVISINHYNFSLKFYISSKSRISAQNRTRPRTIARAYLNFRMSFRILVVLRETHPSFLHFWQKKKSHILTIHSHSLFGLLY